MRTGLNRIKETQNSKTNHAGEGREDSSSPRVLPRSTKLRDLLLGAETNAAPSVAEMEIRQVTCDSRKVQPRALFFALHGAKADGNAFILDAVSRGAVAIVSEDATPPAIPASVTTAVPPQPASVPP